MDSFEHTTTSSAGCGGVAITGMACLFPGAPNVKIYWNNILGKVDSITDPPPQAWNADLFYEAGSSRNDRVYCKRGGFIGSIADFSPVEEGVMPKAVEGGEPDQWLALRVAREALSDARADDLPDAVRRRTGVILGKGTYLNRGNFSIVQHGMVVDQTIEILRVLRPRYTAADIEALREEMKKQLPPFNADTVPGLIPNIIAGRIANRLDLMGPSFTVDAACASSLIAIQMAARDLRSHHLDLAIVGGSHVVTPVPTQMVFCQLGALSQSQTIRPFDREADGTLLGEGVGMIVLKREEDARRDGDRIYALIRGIGTSSDGHGASVMAPRLEGEIAALERAYEMAGFDPQSVGLIEAHGTGTPVGDFTEIAALKQYFGEPRAKTRRCAVGSVKSNIGHLMPAAGIAGVIKASLALKSKILPPTIHCDQPNPAFHLEESSFYVNTSALPWIQGTKTPRRAGVNAFGFGGANAHVVLEEAGNGF